VGGNSKPHFVCLIHLCRFAFGQNTHLVAGLTANAKKHFVPKRTKAF